MRRRFPDDTFERIFLKENVIILIKIYPKFVPDGPINTIPALVQIMAWRRPGDKPLSEPMLVRLLMHICVTWPQWVKAKHVLVACEFFPMPLEKNIIKIIITYIKHSALLQWIQYNMHYNITMS